MKKNNQSWHNLRFHRGKQAATGKSREGTFRRHQARLHVAAEDANNIDPRKSELHGLTPDRFHDGQA